MGEPLPRAETPATEPRAALVEPRENEKSEVLVLTPSELARVAFDKALLNAHREFGPLEKTRPVYRDKPHEVERMLRDGKDPPVKYYFADLTDVLNLTDPVLQENGFSSRMDVAQTDDGDLCYTLTLTHEAGHSIKGIYEVLDAGAEKPNPTASERKIHSRLADIDAIHTHARRYLLCHMLGLPPEPKAYIEQRGAAPVDENAAGIFGNRPDAD